MSRTASSSVSLTRPWPRTNAKDVTACWTLWCRPCSVKAGYECIKAFSETDFTEDLKSIEVPVLVIHSEDDQIVPYADSAPLTAQLLRNSKLKTYKDLPHGCHSTHPDLINADILGFIRGEQVGQTAGAAPATIAEPVPVA